MELDLVHIISERFSILNPSAASILVRTPIVDLDCSCGQVHRLSAWGFLLLENVEATLSLGLREHSLLSIDLVKGGVKGDVLKAISSTLTWQKGRETFNMVCQNKETAWSIATILTKRGIILMCPRVLVTEDIWKEG